MIKHLLYSLFLHSLLLLVIYASFNLKDDLEENKTAEITVTLAPFPGSDKPVENTKPPEPQPIIEEKKEEPKPVEKEKKEEPKPIVKKEEKKEVPKPKAKPVEKKAPPKESKAPKPSEKNKVNQEPKKLEKPKEPEVVKKPAEPKAKEVKKEEKISEKEKPVEIKKDEIKKDGKEQKEDEKLKKEKDLGAKKEDEKKEVTPKETPQKEVVSEAVPEKKPFYEPTAQDLANSLENLDLSARERFNIQSQLRRCFHKALDESKMKSGLKITVKARINEAGYIDTNLDETVDIKMYNDPSQPEYKIAIDNVRRAVDLCSPLRNLPLDKYYIWKEVLLQFDEEK